MLDSQPVQDAPLGATFRRLWKDWLRPYRRQLLFAVCMALIVAVATGAYSKLIQLIMSGLEARDGSMAWWGPIGVIILTSSSGIAQYLRETTATRAIFRMETDLRKQMFSRLVRADLAHLQRESPAALSARFSSDITLAGKSVKSVLGAFTGIATLVVTVGFMLSIDWALALVMVLIFAIALVPINIIGRRLRKLSKSTQAEIANMTSEVSEGLSGIRMARTYQLEEPLERRSDGVFDRLLGLWVKQNKWQARVTPVLEILMGLAVAVLLIVVGARIQSGSISVADFTGLLTGVGILAGPARKLGGTFAAAMQGRAAIDRVFGLFDVDDTILDGDRTIDRGRGLVEFRNVSFSYPDGHTALTNLSLTMAPGTKTAFVGRSGAGKSTVFNLLPRLFDAVSGNIMVDGLDVRELTLRSLRNQIAVVGQDSILFTGTIAENIGFGRRNANREEIEEAGRGAAADEFIRALPDGYDTMIVPSANSFSGGERQRLSIARAILRDAPILLLDEATSALDAESEAQIQTALDRLAKDRTTLVIAHRLSTISDADQIVVMEHGQIAEQGRHEELLALGGIYTDLCRLQLIDS